MILVVGATGLLGGMITSRLLQQGEEVRILARRNSPSEQLARQGLGTSAHSLVARGAQPVIGDLKDRDSLDEAVEGAEVVITTANSALRGGADNVETVDLLGNRSLVDAAAAAGVKQFIFISALGADANSPVPFAQAKGATGEHLSRSGMTYTILVPNGFMDLWLPMVVGLPATSGQTVTLVGQGRRRHSLVAARDVAWLATVGVRNPMAANRTIPIGGPEPVSWRDIVATYEQVLGRPIPVRFVAPGEPVPGLLPVMQGLLAGMETYDSPIEMSETARDFGLTSTSVEQFVRESLAQFEAIDMGTARLL